MGENLLTVWCVVLGAAAVVGILVVIGRIMAFVGGIATLKMRMAWAEESISKLGCKLAASEPSEADDDMEVDNLIMPMGLLASVTPTAAIPAFHTGDRVRTDTTAVCPPGGYSTEWGDNVAGCRHIGTGNVFSTCPTFRNKPPRYYVQHDDDSYAWYDAHELTLLKK